MEKIFEGANLSGVVPELPRGSAVLFSTNIRSSQQDERLKQIISFKKNSNYGKAFKVLDQPPKFCMRNKFVYASKNEKGVITKIHIKGVPCNMWACPNCGIKRAIRLKYYLIEVIKLNGLDRMLTLTLIPSRIPYKYTAYGNNTGKYISFLFNKLRTDLSRKFKQPLKYVWVKQFQDNGSAHLHIMISGYYPIKYIRAKWRQLGGGVEMKIRKDGTAEDSARYMSNYVVKGIKGPNTIDTFRVAERRYSVSLSCIKPKNNYTKPINIGSVQALIPLMDTKDFFEMYNDIQDPSVVDKESILAPHQESLFKT